MKNKLNIFQWILVAISVIGVLANGLHFSSLFLLPAAVLAAPIPLIRDYLKEKTKISGGIAVLLAVAVLVLGIAISPQPSSEDITSSTPSSSLPSAENSFAASSDTGSSQQQDSSSETSSKPSESSSAPSSSASSVQSKPSGNNSRVENEEKVWISKTGKKYHSNPNCGNMKNPSQVTITQAKEQNRTPCSNCW